jgi:hypothetical protein
MAPFATLPTWLVDSARQTVETSLETKPRSDKSLLAEQIGSLLPYCIFGLQVSSNSPLPGLGTTKKPRQQPDVSLHLSATPPISTPGVASAQRLVFASSIQTESGEPSLRIWDLANGEYFRLDYIDGAQFWLDANGNNVWARWPETLCLEDAASYMLGPVFGFLLRLRGVTCLHASAVERDGRAIALAGAEGAGKSTTAAALALRGHAVLSDDIVALEERDGSFYVLPAYPYLSLWPDSVEALYAGGKTLPAFSANFQKRMLSLAASDLQFALEPVRLNSIFLLGERSPDPAAPFVEDVSPREALMTLVSDTYANLLLSAEMRAREFAFLGRLVSAVRVRRLRSHVDASRIGSLCNLIQPSLRRVDVRTASISQRR